MEHIFCTKRDDGFIFISAEYNGKLRTFVYYGYTEESAVADFKESIMVKGQ